MARPLRIEFPGAVYHAISRGDRREDIFVDDEDRQGLLAVVSQALSRFDAEALAYCLSLLMRHINGAYTQTYNRRHHKVGHLFQGRFKAILVDRDAYLLEVCRYVDLNPVRAHMVPKPQDWAWSSYRAHLGQAPVPAWLDTPGLHGYLLGQPAKSSGDRRRAADRYAQLVASVPDASLWDSARRQQIDLGDESFVERMQALAEPRNSTDRDIPRAQRRKSRTLAQWLASCENREEALYRAHTESAQHERDCTPVGVVGIAREPADRAGGGGKTQGLTADRRLTPDRRYGFLANRCRAGCLERIRQSLHSELREPQSDGGAAQPIPLSYPCPACQGGQMRVTGERAPMRCPRRAAERGRRDYCLTENRDCSTFNPSVPFSLGKGSHRR